MIDKISNTIVNDKVKSVYGFNDYSIQDLLSKFFEQINSVTDLVNQNEEKINTQNFKLEEFINYMKNEGIPSSVIETVTTMYNDGRLTELFNSLANNVIDKVEEFKTQVNSSLEQIDNEVKKPITLNKCDEEMLGAIQNKEGETTFNLLSIPRDNSVSPQKLNKNYNIITELDFIVGTISSANGTDSTSTTRLRSSNFIEVKKGYKLLAKDGYKFGIFMYKNSDISTFISSDGTWYSSYVFETACYIRITLKNDDDSIDIANYIDSVGTLIDIPDSRIFIDNEEMLSNDLLTLDKFNENTRNYLTKQDGYILPFKKDFSTYTTSTFTGAINRLFIINTPITSNGKVNIHFMSKTTNGFYVVHLRNISNYDFEVISKELIDVEIGENKIETNINITSQDGKDYIGICGLESGNTPSGVTKTISTTKNYLNFLSFTNDTVNLTATPQTTGSDIGIYFEIVKEIESLPNEIVELDKRVTSLESNSLNYKTVDLAIFMGQSNMAGRGESENATILNDGEGYEFRAISNPTQLYKAVEPFGINENNSASGVTENKKTGGMVTSIMKKYYEVTKVPIVGVSCSKGGTAIDWWKVGSLPLQDAIERHNKAKQWLLDNGYTIRHDFMVWCQGESDGDVTTDVEVYKTKTTEMIDEMFKNGIEKCFVVRIGNDRSNSTKYDYIMKAQNEICQTKENVILVGNKFCEMADRGLMKDQFHYYQSAYNEQGFQTGTNIAYYYNNLKEPIMYDKEFGNIYITHKY